MRTPQLADNLRRAVLQAAIEGKLNDRTSEDARDLLAAIQTEKTAQQKTGKQKKNKPLAAISEEEIPFAIPENWVWVRLGDILFQLTDGTHSTPKYVEQGIPFLSVKNISSGKISFQDTKFISEDEHLELTKRCKPEKGDILLSKVGTTGIPVLIEDEVEFSIFVSVALLKFPNNLINSKFLLNIIQSPFVQEQAQGNTRGVGNKNWVLTSIANTLIPLPPLTEQQQIVAKLNRLLAEIDNLKTQEQALLAAQNAFPKKLRAAILQAAVQGELNERTDENARDLFAAIQAEKAALQKAGKLKKDKPLAAISEEEIPFAIPENWVWVRLGEISSKITDGSHNPPPKRVSGIPILSAANIFEQKIQFSSANRWISYEEWEIENKRTSIDPNDVLLTIVGTIGRTAVVEDDTKFALQRSVAVIKPILISSIYLSYLLQSPFLLEIMTLVSKGTAQKGIYLNSLKDLPIPLPPLSEQQQIVAKLETLLAEIDTLENAA